jgi:ATP-dependent DNA helicase DinG
MPKQPPIRVALDLETTGLHAEQDAILEVAAVKFQGATILDTMETLVAPGRPIPFRVQRLTGIMPQLVADAPSFAGSTWATSRYGRYHARDEGLSGFAPTPSAC